MLGLEAVGRPGDLLTNQDRPSSGLEFTLQRAEAKENKVHSSHWGFEDEEENEDDNI